MAEKEGWGGFFALPQRLQAKQYVCNSVKKIRQTEMERERRREAQAVPAVPAPRFPARCGRRELRCGCRGAECSGARPGHRGGDGPAQPGSRKDPHLQGRGRSPGAAVAPLCPTAAGGPGRAGSCRELRGRSAFGQRCGAVPGSAGQCRAVPGRGSWGRRPGVLRAAARGSGGLATATALSLLPVRGVFLEGKGTLPRGFPHCGGGAWPRHFPWRAAPGVGRESGVPGDAAKHPAERRQPRGSGWQRVSLRGGGRRLGGPGSSPTRSPILRG